MCARDFAASVLAMGVTAILCEQNPATFPGASHRAQQSSHSLLHYKVVLKSATNSHLIVNAYGIMLVHDMSNPSPRDLVSWEEPRLPLRMPRQATAATKAKGSTELYV
jgi:hypothetical protein